MMHNVGNGYFKKQDANSWELIEQEEKGFELMWAPCVDMTLDMSLALQNQNPQLNWKYVFLLGFFEW
jgi:hypothetical protein